MLHRHEMDKILALHPQIFDLFVEEADPRQKTAGILDKQFGRQTE